MKKKHIVAVLSLLVAGSVLARTAVDLVSKVEMKACPASVDYRVKDHDGTRQGIGLITLKVKFGDVAIATNSFSMLEIDRISNATNTLLGPVVFTNSFVYTPTALFIAAGNTIRFTNTYAGADIDFAFEVY